MGTGDAILGGALALNFVSSSFLFAHIWRRRTVVLETSLRDPFSAQNYLSKCIDASFVIFLVVIAIATFFPLQFESLLSASTITKELFLGWTVIVTIINAVLFSMQTLCRMTLHRTVGELVTRTPPRSSASKPITTVFHGILDWGLSGLFLLSAPSVAYAGAGPLVCLIVSAFALLLFFSISLWPFRWS